MTEHSDCREARSGVWDVWRIALTLLALGALLALNACTPWVVRPLNPATGQAQTGEQQFSAVSYVDGIWDSKVVPTVQQNAKDIRTVLDALKGNPDTAKTQYGHQEGSGRPYNFIVKGEGKVLKVDTSSMQGTLAVDVPPYDGKADITIQVGPVMSGTSLRDGVGFIHYSEFTNQIDYASVADELNNRVLKGALSKVDIKSLQDKVVTFTGVFSYNDLDPSTLVLTPVELAAKGGS